MPTINIDSIMRKVKDYSESDSGKAKMAKVIRERRMNGNGKLASGDYVITEQDMQRLAEELIKTMREEASMAQYELPQSVLDHFNSLTYTHPKSSSNGAQYSIDIYFQDDLSRMSLLVTSGSRKGQRTGENIENIVSLFDTGYKTSKRVYGTWDGHEEDGVIASRTELEGKYFIEKALASFNRKYGDTYHLVARVTASPEFYSNFNYT